MTFQRWIFNNEIFYSNTIDRTLKRWKKSKVYYCARVTCSTCFSLATGLKLRCETHLISMKCGRIAWNQVKTHCIFWMMNNGFWKMFNFSFDCLTSIGTMIEWGNNWARGINFRTTNDVAFAGFFSQIGRLYNVHHIWCKYFELFVCELVEFKLPPDWRHYW